MAGSAPTTMHGRLRAHDDARPAPRRRRTAGLSMPWCRPSICSIWWNARFEDLSRTFGLSGVLRTPPQTHQPVLGDGQGAGAYSKSKLLRLVRYCDEGGEAGERAEDERRRRGVGRRACRGRATPRGYLRGGSVSGARSRSSGRAAPGRLHVLYACRCPSTRRTQTHDASTIPFAGVRRRASKLLSRGLQSLSLARRA